MFFTEHYNFPKLVKILFLFYMKRTDREAETIYLELELRKLFDFNNIFSPSMYFIFAFFVTIIVYF